MSKQVRVRFAPSPTGPLHIGGVRTALFNYLFAKKNNGVFYLRIEDTDQNRFVPGAEEYIMEALDWLGIAPSETVGKNEKFGPYRQSERKHLYKQYADQLIDSGWAYYAFDTAEALDTHRKQHEAEGKTFIYNWHNREKLDTSLVISAAETDKRIAAGEDYVIRFKTPVNETLHLHDIIRGDIKFETNLLDDKVLFKSDGMPTYHLANIVDDHLMETSHVIRGEEWLPSMPLHNLLYKAFGWEAPEFAHLPLILKPIGNGKLSKRDGDKMGFPVFPLDWTDPTTGEKSSGYREKGFFPEAVVNFLALLGWNDGTDQELFTLEELCERFDLNRVHKAGAKFDPEKNKWFNHQYLQKQSNEDLAKEFVKNIPLKDLAKQIQNIAIENISTFDNSKIAINNIAKQIQKIAVENISVINNSRIEVSDIAKQLQNIAIENASNINNINFSINDLSKQFQNIGVQNFSSLNNLTKELQNSLKELKIDKTVSLIKERADFVSDFWEMSDFFFETPTTYDEKAAKNWKEETPDLMRQLIEVLKPIEDFTSITIETIVKDWMTKNEIGMGKVMQPFRLSLVGALKGPHLFDIVELIGKEETIKRLEKAIASL